MMKVAQFYTDEEMFATLSQTVTEPFLGTRDYRGRYQTTILSTDDHCRTLGVRQLRDKTGVMAYERSLVAVKPEDEIVKTLERVTPTHMGPDVVLRNSLC